MKQKPNPDAIMSELGRESAFFREAAQGPQPTPETATATQDRPAPTIAQPTAAVLPVRDVRPVRRKKTRHPFDLYEDQVDRLRELSAKDRMRGGMGSMSEMVREAIDEYLARQAEEDRT